ncbi:hypothetical protein BC937DRAFT_91759 [Endogone sp. FLAS-F59071]|nr:hypothetical protein BC937DRAFT_91759 [Endogone sp. FLAS-F59071]|eukprot:RUS21709.1 hypothetical protein BC937DRAFT_91759 [Endogone sp. FLAS-F59071]
MDFNITTPTTGDPSIVDFTVELDDFSDFEQASHPTPDTTPGASVAPFGFDDDENLNHPPPPSFSVQQPFPSVTSFFAGPASGYPNNKRRTELATPSDGFARNVVGRAAFGDPGDGFIGVDTRVYAEDLKEQKMPAKREQLREGKVARVMELEDKMGPVQHTSQSIHIKDDTGITECKIWYSTPEASKIFNYLTIDSLVTIHAPQTRASANPNHFASGIRSLGIDSTLVRPTIATTNVALSLADRDVVAGNAAIEKIDNDPGWFRRPIGKGRIVPLAEVVAGAAGEGREEGGGGEKIRPAQAIRTRRGPSHRRAIVVFDDSAADVELTLWGEHVLMADAWIALQTVLLITNPQVTVFRDKTQLGITFRSYIEVNPELKQAEFLHHFVRTIAPGPGPPSEMIPVMQIDDSGVKVSRPQLHTNVPSLQSATCRTPVVPLSSTFSCPTCSAPLSASYALSTALSFIDDTGELRHPRLTSGAARALMRGCEAGEFWKMDTKEKGEVKRAVLFERFKIYFKMYWNDAKHTPSVLIIDGSIASLLEMESVYEV